MCKNSTELLDYALRELQVAVEEKKGSVDIILIDECPRDIDKMQDLVEKLEIPAISEMLKPIFHLLGEFCYSTKRRTTALKICGRSFLLKIYVLL